MNDLLLNALTKFGLAADEIGGTFNVRHGAGPLAQSVNIDPEQFLTWLAARSDNTRQRDVTSWANGVLTTLLEPKRSDARTWSFTESAGSIFPTIEGPGFAHGVRDASGEEAWITLLPGADTDELVVGWVMRLGRGLRPITVPQVADWGATKDRIEAAGRSLLFHATRHHHFTPVGEVLELAVGDGHDAARLLVAADVFFTDVDERWRFAIPHPDVLLAVRSPEQTDALVQETSRRHEVADYRLATGIWRLTATGPVRDRR